MAYIDSSQGMVTPVDLRQQDLSEAANHGGKHCKMKFCVEKRGQPQDEVRSSGIFSRR